jgi:hypothetical protein
MSNYTLTEGLYLYPTPAGAYYAVSSTETDSRRQFLRRLLQQSSTPALNLNNLKDLVGVDDPEKCYEMLFHCHKLNWVQGIDAAERYPSDSLENILPGLLRTMSESGKVLLADIQGFYLASHGFPHDVAEELSALSAELTNIHERRAVLLMDNLGVSSNAWALIDVFGNSQIGFWPLFIGSNRFVIVISGVPHFNQPEFVKLIWALSKRYATKAD